MTMIRNALLAFSAMALSANSGTANRVDVSTKNTPSEAEWQQTRKALSDHIRTLADDEYEGRKPGTEGGRKTQQYLIDALKSYGFEPGAGTGSDKSKWRQKVELVKNTPNAATLIAINGDKRVEIGGDSIIMDGPKISLDAVEAVYIDVKEKPLEVDELKGKVGIIPLNKFWPSFGLIAKASPELIIATTVNSLQHSSAISNWQKSETWHLKGRPKSSYFPSTALLNSQDSNDLWAHWGGAKSTNGQFYQRPDEPGALEGSIKIISGPKREFIESANVIGKLPGRTPNAGAVVMLAHWDHLGICKPDSEEDKICNGAVDNASGTGAILEVARQIAADGGLDRDLYVMGVTAEEVGLLGTEAFANDPPVPLTDIVAAFNMDAIAIAPRGSPVTVIGWGRTGLDEDIAEVIKRSGGTLELDDEDQELIKRSDQWALLKRDVPAVSIESGSADNEGWKKYERGPYHKSSDEWSDELELGGATDDIFLHIEMLKHFGNLDSYPAKVEVAKK